MEVNQKGGNGRCEVCYGVPHIVGVSKHNLVDTLLVKALVPNAEGKQPRRVTNTQLAIIIIRRGSLCFLTLLGIAGTFAFGRRRRGVGR